MNSNQNGPEGGGVQYEVRDSREGSQFPEHTNCLPMKKTPSTTEAKESRGLETMEQTRLEKLMQPKHNNVLVFNSVVASVYTTSTETWAYWFYSLARIRKIEGTYASLLL